MVERRRVKLPSRITPPWMAKPARPPIDRLPALLPAIGLSLVTVSWPVHSLGQAEAKRRFQRAVWLDRGQINDPSRALSYRALRATAERWDMHDAVQAGKVAELAKGAELVVTILQPLDSQFFEQVRPQLVVVAAAGTDHVDLAAARKVGCQVCNLADSATEAVAEHTVWLIDQLAQRVWPRTGPPELKESTIGIVGWGRIGRQVAAEAQARGMQVEVALGNRSGGEQTFSLAGDQRTRLPMLALLAGVDIVSLHVPLADNTQALIGAAEIAQMPSHALLINTSRGLVLDEQALLDALNAGAIAGAGLDVRQVEPVPPGDQLAAHPTVVSTAHIGWEAAKQRILDDLVTTIEAYLAGEPINIVTGPTVAAL